MIIVEKFEQILLDFLKVNHPRKVKKVPEIVKEFRGNEVALLKALCDRYQKDYTVIPNLKESIDIAQAQNQLVNEGSSEEEVEPIAQLEKENDDDSDELDDVEETNTK